MKRTVSTVLVVLALAAGACSNDGEETGTSGTAPTSTPDGSAPPPYSSEIYGDLANWICHPDKAEDPCTTDLDVTVLEAGGVSRVQPHVVADSPSVDCFYVYPTISSDQSINSDLQAGIEEINTVRSQVAHLSSVCEVYAPVYRQFTLAVITGGVTGDRQGAGEIAYGDVRDAWNEYRANHNDGRGVIFVGHSQGSGHLNRLLREEIETDEQLRSQVVSAYLLGNTVRVPAGEDVGGDFQHLPLCRAEDQTGCVVSYASFRATAPPPANSFFGRPRSGDGVAACVNPAALAGGPAPLTPYFASNSPAFADGSSVETPFAAFPGLVTGECVERDGFSYLAITVNGDPGDPRIDDVSGDLTPEWGLHVIDANLAMGDLVSLAQRQADAHSGS